MKDIYIIMNRQNILNYYGSKLDLKLDSSELYDYQLTTNEVDYDTDVLDLSTPITYSALTIEKLVEIKIPHIGVPEQLKIVNEFNDLSKTINNLEVNLIKKKDLVIELRQSLLGDAFTQKEEVA